MFDLNNAERRLDAARFVSDLLAIAQKELGNAEVRNAKVHNSLGACSAEMAKYIRTTKFAIRKRKDREKCQR